MQPNPPNDGVLKLSWQCSLLIVLSVLYTFMLFLYGFGVLLGGIVNNMVFSDFILLIQKYFPLASFREVSLTIFFLVLPYIIIRVVIIAFLVKRRKAAVYLATALALASLILHLITDNYLFSMIAVLELFAAIMLLKNGFVSQKNLN
ncbi:hypothetical protein EMN47_06670 [Prolixibacteraceae bacterium JC049]|nr:hypothetical protein [Prolixibacteraceae bacterium JC049]